MSLPNRPEQSLTPPGPASRATTGLSTQRKFARLGIVVGAMKAGTTSLFSALSEHPHIAASKQKETDFFKTAASAERGLDVYESFFPFDPHRHKIAFEASPNYAKFPENTGVAERLAATPYDLRLIYVMRHPVQRYVSHYIHAVARGYGVRDIHREIDPNALSASSYASQLAVFAQHIAREKILLVRFEDLKSQPQPQFDRITAHLGVARGAWSGFPHQHASVHFHLGKAVDALKAEGAKLDGRYAAPVLRADGQVDLRKTFLPVDMAPRLHAALRDDMRRLHEDWGFDVKPWGF